MSLFESISHGKLWKETRQEEVMTVHTMFMEVSVLERNSEEKGYIQVGWQGKMD